ncbi:MAG: chromosome segregation protein SMC [Deltaproteobacteria bacterium]|nr:chromosome segregation protein SMC [Deltaproteobacteria bacterium]
MRIKRLDLCGFKSFCDKAVLDLRQPVSGVVGPNGCGKSNIVDALRWAMGEQSARHLRGKSMEDVIFNGSDSRGPSGMAEISITFENDGRVPAEYLSYSEITITRRLYRDGTSEYEINKLPVRLRDITNLFLGTGVGTKAYSIIEQGRIGLIVSAKPEDRRYYLEEAAGITKYRRRKEAAERKMDATRQNLLRVTDVLEEIGKRLGTLRRQAKKAERYKQYKAEMRDIELWNASHRLLELVAAGKVVEAATAELSGQREEVQTGLDRHELELEGARATSADEERKVSAVQEELYQVDHRMTLNQNALQFQSHEATELERRATEARDEVEQLGRQLAEAESQLQVARGQTAEAEGRRAEIEHELRGRQAVQSELRAELQEVEQVVEAERQSLGGAERAAARSEANLRALGQRRRDLAERSERRREEGERLVERVTSLKAAAEELEGQLVELRVAMQELEERRGQLKARLSELSGQAEHGETALEVLRTELHRRRSRLNSLEEIAARYEGFGRGTRAIMQRLNGSAHKRGVLGLVADVMEAPSAYETALEAVLGQRLGTIIVDDEHVGLEAIEYLKSSAEGRSSFIARFGRKGLGLLDAAPVGFVWDPNEGREAWAEAGAGGAVSTAAAPGVHGAMMSLIQCRGDYRGVAERLLGDVVVVEDLPQALAVWDRIDRQTLVTLEGEILSPDGTVTGGSADAELSGVLRQKREIKELSDIIRDLEQEYGRALDQHVAVKSEMAALEHLLTQATKDGHQGDKDILTREKDVGRLASEVRTLLTRRQDLDEELGQLGRDLESTEDEELSLRDEVDRAHAQGRLASDMLHLLRGERTRLLALVDHATHAVTDAKVSLAHAESLCQSSSRAAHALDEQCQDRRERIVRLEEGAAQGVARAAELRESAARIEVELKELSERRAVCQESLAEGRQRHEACLARVGEVELELKQLRHQASELSAELAKQQLRASEVGMLMGHLTEQVWERYRVPLRAVAGDYHLRPLVTEAELQRIDELRQVIDRMGEINLTAIEEYEELNGRYEFLSTHQKDLDGALNQLQRAIQKINRTCRVRFKETFDAVNERFQVVFPRLFNGGRAKLVLTDEQDPLQAGVEIIAQPPGKKLGSIDMMSGGEKALTAVSMIFAMFLVKPTPFCLLDEVDAPLDEANVIRFKDLVREMSETSQFIIITHNRRTMEIADRLYGVTMEEPGASKLVSVNLSEAQAQVAA